MAAQHILVVDDDPDTLKLISMVLEDQGYRVTQAGTGDEALDIVEVDLPNLIVLDVMMPETDGFTVARRIRAGERTADVPIIMFTSLGLVDDQATGYEAGVNAYLTKPAHPAELVARVKTLLSRAAGNPNDPTPPRGGVLACIGVSYGLVTARVATGIALALGDVGAESVISAEMYQGAGALAGLRGVRRVRGLAGLLDHLPEDLTPAVVELELVALRENVRVLPYAAAGQTVRLAPEQAWQVTDALADMVSAVVLDLGVELDDVARHMALRSSHVVLVARLTDPDLSAGARLIEALRRDGLAAEQTSAVLVYGESPGDVLDVESLRAELTVSRAVAIPLGVPQERPRTYDDFRAFIGGLREHLDIV
jgi:CheY-like chemotaxis protein